MFKTIKFLFVTTVIAMVFTASAHAFLGFGNSDKWKQMDSLAIQLTNDGLVDLGIGGFEIKEIDRVEQNEIALQDDSKNYAAAYDVTFNHNSRPGRLVLYIKTVEKAYLEGGVVVLGPMESMGHLLFAWYIDDQESIDASDERLLSYIRLVRKLEGT